MKRLFVGCLISLLSLMSHAGDPDYDAEVAASLSWERFNMYQLRSLLVDIPHVNAFLAKYTHVYDAVDNIVHGYNQRACEYRITDLRLDGNVQLVVLTGEKETNHCGGVLIVSKVGDKFVQQNLFPEEALGKLREVAVDLVPNGKTQFIIPRQLAYLQQAEGDPSPMFYDVYDWDGTKYAPNNKAYKSYYKNVRLPALKAELNRVSNWKAPKHLEMKALIERACNMEIAEINKVLATP